MGVSGSDWGQGGGPFDDCLAAGRLRVSLHQRIQSSYRSSLGRRQSDARLRQPNSGGHGSVGHRDYGPEIFRSVIRLAQDRESTLPEEIEGRPLALCLDGILGAFLKYGSPVLKKDIIMELPDASGLGGLSYEQLLERLGTSSRE